MRQKLWRLEDWWDGLSDRERDAAVVGGLAALVGICIIANLVWD